MLASHSEMSDELLDINIYVSFMRESVNISFEDSHFECQGLLLKSFMTCTFQTHPKILKVILFIKLNVMQSFQK